MSTILFIALALPLVGGLLLIWSCLLLAARMDAEMPVPHEGD